VTLAAIVALLTALIGIGSVVAATLLQRGPLLSPFSTSMAVLVSIFGIRPLLEIQLGVHVFYGHDVTDGVRGATMVGFVAVVCCAIGYVSRRRPPRPFVADASSTDSLLPAARAAAVLIALWLAAMVYVGGGVHFLSILFSGRNAATRRALQGVPVLVSTLPTAAAILVAVHRIRIERVRPLLRVERVAFAAVVIASLVPPMALGNRRFLLPSLIAASIAVMLPKFDRRVPLRAAAAGAVVFVLLISIPFARSTGAVGNTSTIGGVGTYLGNDGIGGAVQRYFLSFDTEMFGYVSYLDTRLGSEIPYGYGKWFAVDSVLAPLPSSAAEAFGVRTRSNDVLQDMVGHGCDVSRTCPVPSLPGISYAEFGLLGVVVALFLWGRLCHAMQHALAAARGHRLTAIVTFIGSAPVLMRGNTVNLAWIAVNVLALAVAADVVCRRRAARRERVVHSIPNLDVWVSK
jgi:hypothetical protein